MTNLLPLLRSGWLRLAVAVTLSATAEGVRAQDPPGPPRYVPASQELHDTIVRLDARWEDAYNTCKMDVHEALIAEDLEFFHDLGGLSTSKRQVLEAVKANVCGKVTRELLPGSIEVYPIKDYGAVQMGYHRFRNVNEPGVGRYARFVHVWRLADGRWQLTRVISLH
ncbi:DUF4440 domain-containing protein [Luteitalea sp. TBR-22]|uniref:nuclear transport factor 2 family protein n=1 Tax=Luteitalea sp. TBR-22 TaxID=2802971 RepID=UPI001AF8B083|nr:nuclear transport factor 2 family protein [Luteitalea sp. TBR-22]BCS34632.1 DUF4440 domain-containing protein [Luteitalea sp. TBR-22]